MNKLTRIKVITGYAPLARFLAEMEEGYVGEIPRVIPTPYSYSQTHVVMNWQGTPVIVAETRHRRYEVFQVEGPISPLEEG